MKKPLKNPMKKPQFVDRKRELDRLLRALDRARDGTGDVIDIRGEAGIGKSRLIEEVTSEALNRGFSILRGRCLDYRRSPYLPFIEMLREYFKILHELSYSENLDAITKMIGEKYPNLLQNAAILIDFFYPKGEPLGSYFIHQDRTSDSLSFLRRKGFRTVIIGSPETVEKHLLEDVESIVIGDGERNSIPPGRVEELENRVREVFNKYRHVAIVFSSVKELMGANPTERMRDFFSTAASLTRMNGGVMVVPNDSDPGKMVPDIRDLSPYLTESSEGESHLKD